MKASEYAIRYKDGVMSSDYDTCVKAEQELLLISSVFSLVNEGVKKSTLRKGRRDIHTGPLTFKMTENENCTVKVNVLNVSYLPFSEISEKHAKKRRV